MMERRQSEFRFVTRAGFAPPAVPLSPSQRRYERAEADYLVEFSEFPQTLPRERWVGRILDLSPAGLSIDASEAVAPGTLLRLHLHVHGSRWSGAGSCDDGPHPGFARLLGKVVHARRHRTDSWHLGIRLFAEAGDQDILITLYHRLRADEILRGVV